MKRNAEEIVIIDLELRFILFGLQMLLEVPFSVQEMERVFTDSMANHVSSKNYLFHESLSVTLSGSVDAYEPETITLRLSHRDAPTLLRRVIEAAHYEMVRIREFDGRIAEGSVPPSNSTEAEQGGANPPRPSA